jgi:endonuclease/exonuclease/phosphatase family metal-dependent hydrolase
MPLNRPAPSLRVATYNIHGFVGMDGLRQPGRIRQVLEEIRADVVAIQEIDCFETTDNLTTQLRLGSNSLPFKAIAGPTLLGPQSTSFGNAILTHLDIDEIRRVDISLYGKEPRGVIDVCLHKDCICLRVLATHLGLQWTERNKQMQQLTEQIMAGPTNTPIVLLGDLNEPFPYTRGFRKLCRVMGATRAIPTFPSPFPLFALDRILVRPRTALRCIEVHRSPMARRASDHLPLKADIFLTAH